MRLALTSLAATLLVALTGVPGAPGVVPAPADGPGTAPAMHNTATPTYVEPALRLTSPYTRGATVAELQRLLGVSADGVFGPITNRALRSFQYQHHLPVTGVSDARTWATLRISRLHGVGTAHQVISVTNTSWTATTALVRTFERRSTGWYEVYAPVAAHIGRNGFGLPKREGDGQSPVGYFGVQAPMFGTSPNPGVHYAYHHTTTSDFWVDDSRSPYYNTWRTGRQVDATHAVIYGRVTHVERLYVTTAYQYMAVIGYNTARKPYAGSAIFLHVDTGRATAGCVAMPRTSLVAVLRWLTPTAAPRVVMGPRQVVGG